MKSKLSFFLTATLAVFLFASQAFAQIPGGGSNVSVDVFPAHPGPFDSVTVTLTSFSVNLKSADITWTLDKKLVLGGIGKTKFSFTAKNIGTTSTLSINIVPSSGPSVTKTISITPMGLDLLWQATDSVVPPMYRGKAMPSSEATIKFVAIPNIKSPSGSLFSRGSLIYSWKNNFDDTSVDSGFGKDSYAVLSSYLNRSEHVDVSAQNLVGNMTADASATIVTGKPKILWYADSPLYGPLFNQSLGNDYSVNGSEVTVFAEPYFFSPSNPASKNLSYAWVLNGASLDTPSTPNVLFLHRDNNSAGTANVSVSVSSIGKLFQEATSSLTLHLQ